MARQDSAAAERRIILSYAPGAARAGLAALLALDDRLADVVRTTREPMVGQMRLTWWHDALTALDHDAVPAEPIVQALADAVVPHVAGSRLARLVEGWEELLDPEPLDAARLARFAELRGADLFAAGGVILGAGARDPLAAAGRGWALADLAANIADPETQALARALATTALDTALATRWSSAARALGAMAHLAARPDAPPPARAARALWHRLTGY